jgi:DNA-binding transcriptional MerR regulator
VYGPEHLQQLEEIRRLQGRGLTLADIAQQQALRSTGSAATTPEAEPEAWWQYRVAPDVVVQVRGDVSPWRLKQVRTRLAEMAAALRGPATPEVT